MQVVKKRINQNFAAIRAVRTGEEDSKYIVYQVAEIIRTT